MEHPTPRHKRNGQNGAIDLQNQLQKLRTHISRGNQPVVEVPTQKEETFLSEYAFTIVPLFDAIRRYIWYIIILSLIVGGFTYNWSKKRPKKYKATAIVGVVPGSKKVFTQIRDVISYHYQLRRFYATQLTVMKSDQIAQKALELVPEVLNSPGFYGLSKVKDKKKRYVIMAKLRPKAALILKSRTSVSPIRKSSLFKITVRDSNPVRAQKLANAISLAYSDYNLKFRLKATKQAYGKIKEQRDKFQKKREDLQNKLLSFRKKNNVLTTSLDDRRNIAFKQLEALNQRYIKVMLSRIELESQLKSVLKNKRRLKYIKDPMKEHFPAIFNSALIQELKAHHNKQELERKKLLYRYRAKHPLVQKATNHLKKLKKLIKHHILLVYSSYMEKLRAARHEERRLKRKVLIAKNQLQRVHRLNLEFDHIQHKMKDVDRSLSFLNRRFFEVQLLKDSTTTNVRLVQKSRKPGAPYSPRVFRDTAAGVLASFIGFLFIFFLSEFIDRTVRSFEEMESKSGVTPIGDVPIIQKKKGFVGEVLYNPDRPLTQIEEAIRSIRTNIQFMSPDRPFRKYLVTSPSPREGKTYMCTNLAIGIAHGGKKTILIDTDMRRPRIHKILDLDFDRSKGSSSVIIGQTTLEESMIKSQFPNLWVLPCGPIPPSPTEMIQTEGFMDMMRELEERFDVIIFDSPPILNVTDAAVLSTFVDGVILVCQAGSTNWSALHTAARKIESVGGNLLGAILNKYDPKKSRGYGGYGSYRGYYYSPYRYAPKENEDE